MWVKYRFYGKQQISKYGGDGSVILWVVRSKKAPSLSPPPFFLEQPSEILFGLQLYVYDKSISNALQYTCIRYQVTRGNNTICKGVSLTCLSLQNMLFPSVLLLAFNFLKSGLYEPRSEKTGLRDFRPGLTQTGLYRHRRWLEA